MTPPTAVDVLGDASLAARRARLRHVSDDEPGYTRKRKGRGFAYYSADNKHVKDETLKERFKDLVIPPMWDDVWICADERGHVQATGYDARGRKQYIYHDKWREVRARAKYDALIPFGEALPALRERLEKDLRQKSLSKAKLVAATVKLLETTLIRIGNREYAEENGSYGLTTLRKKHVDVEGEKLEFSFTGKSGVEHEIVLENRQLAKLIKQVYDLPGYELFKYIDEDGNKHILESADVNEYLQAAMGEGVTAKDIRTWSASVLMSELLCEGDCPDEVDDRAKQVSTTVKQVAEHLGNTPAVCRSSYIHPLLLEDYAEGCFQDKLKKQLKKVRRRKLKYLSESEATFLAYLKASA